MNPQPLYTELIFKTSRSGGAGGQNVNKVSSKVELIFDVAKSTQFTAEQKETIFIKLANRIDNEGLLHLQCDETRSQLKNKEIVVERLINLLETALKPVKKRKPSKPSKSSIRKRLENKKKLSDKKDTRRFKLD
ncbi:MAG: aminoacyl-tRNA hydrolase [Bacteroidetes bacterium]|nr:aminoacyl-tRNA hydrolase [Bacteroidota bacterium]